MPPTKKKRLSLTNITNNAKSSKRKTKNFQDEVYEVAEVLSCRLDPDDCGVSLQFLISWQNFGPESNSWEPLDSLRLNKIFIGFINEKFKEFEADIFVTIENIKMMQRHSRRRLLQEELKVAIMQRVYPFCPFEFKVYQVVQHLIPNLPVKYNKFLEDLVFRNYFFKLEEVQRIKLDNLAKIIMEKEGIKVIVENDVDFEVPLEFEYINKNVCSEEMLISIKNGDSQMECKDLDNPEKINLGCKCGKNGCSKNSKCCPKSLGLPFAYRKTKRFTKLRLNFQESIIECSDNCLCDKNCLNRVTQQKRNLYLCLFKTESRGWALKTMEPIEKGIFILEYTGELLGCGIAALRKETSYMFDINTNRQNHGFYILDAYKYGNLARFVNHSCEPNASMWEVSECTKSSIKQKLCIFALRDIQKDEEITIDYSPIETMGGTERLNSSHSFNIECFCESKRCRGTIY